MELQIQAFFTDLYKNVRKVEFRTLVTHLKTGRLEVRG